MNQQQFEANNEAAWRKLEALLAKDNADIPQSSLQSDYLKLCQHLALAKQRLYDATLIDRLNKLSLHLYREIYRHRNATRINVLEFFVHGFPLSIYQHRWYIVAALLLFLLPGVGVGIWVYVDENAVYSVLDGVSVRQVESMYDPGARKLGRERESDTDIFMFGFYIKNNIGIAFRCFAGGILFGIGSIFIIAFNGLYIGGIAGHLTRLEFGETFYPFVVGHGAFELTAIVFSGAAGLKLGAALIMPGGHTRLSALRRAGRTAVPMLYGILLMLITAAFIEAFWSSSTVLSITVKYSVGALLWAGVLLYCFLGARFAAR